MWEKIKQWWEQASDKERKQIGFLAVVVVLVLISIPLTWCSNARAEGNQLMVAYTTNLSGKTSHGLFAQACNDNACIGFQREKGSDYLALTGNIQSDSDFSESGWAVLQPGVALRNWKQAGLYGYAGAGGLTEDWGAELGVVGYHEFMGGEHSMTKGLLGVRWRDAPKRPTSFERPEPEPEPSPCEGAETCVIIVEP